MRSWNSMWRLWIHRWAWFNHSKICTYIKTSQCTLEIQVNTMHQLPFWSRHWRLPNIESYSLGLSIEWSNRAKGTSRIKEFILKLGTRTPRQARMNEPVALLKTFSQGFYCDHQDGGRKADSAEQKALSPGDQGRTQSHNYPHKIPPPRGKLRQAHG